LHKPYPSMKLHRRSERKKQERNKKVMGPKAWRCLEVAAKPRNAITKESTKCDVS